eukprot:8327775-Pyramimonas_sp.AAC.1
MSTLTRAPRTIPSRCVPRPWRPKLLAPTVHFGFVVHLPWLPPCRGLYSDARLARVRRGSSGHGASMTAPGVWAAL